MGSARHNHRGNSVLEDQLFLIVGLEHDRIFIERPDAARQLPSAHQVNRDDGFFFACRIEKRVLDVLCRLVFHLADLLPSGQRSTLVITHTELSGTNLLIFRGRAYSTAGVKASSSTIRPKA